MECKGLTTDGTTEGDLYINFKSKTRPVINHLYRRYQEFN